MSKEHRTANHNYTIIYLCNYVVVLIKYSKLLVSTFKYKNLKYTTLSTPLARVIPGIGVLIADTVSTCHSGNQGAHYRIRVMQKKLCYSIIIDRAVPVTPSTVVKETARPKGSVHFYERSSRTNANNNGQLHPRPSINPGKCPDKLVYTKGGGRRSR